MSNVGKSVPRTDGADKVTGRALYVDDLTFPGMLLGATIRSTEPHARLVGIDWDPAFDWSRVVRVTADNIPGTNCIFLMSDDQPALASGIIRHAEEPVALIAAESREILEEARRHVKLRTEPLTPIFDLEESRRAEAPIYLEDNVFKRIEIAKGDAAAALASAPHVYQAIYRVGYQEQMYIEPQGVIAIPGDNGSVTIYGSLQCPFYVVKALAPLLGVEKEAVRVVQCVTGGGFGGKEEYPSMLSGHAALLARQAGRPVKMIYDRSEDIAATTKRHPGTIRHTTGVDDEGRLVAMDIEILLDGGAYLTLSPVVLSRAAIHATGPYRCPNVRVFGLALATHTPPNGAFRGFGAPQVCFAVERHLDRIARALNLSPLEIRRRNLLKEGDVTATGQELRDSVGGEAVLDTVLERSGYEKRHAELEAQSGGRYRRGIGLAVCFHGAGFTGNGEVRIAGKLDAAIDADGNVVIYTGSTDIGQGTLTIFPQIAADALGVALDQVRLETPDTAQVPDSGPTVASRTAMVVGQLVDDACGNLAQALVPPLAQLLEIAPGDLRFEGGAYRWVAGELPFPEAARRVHAQHGPVRARAEYRDRGDLVWDDATYRGDAYPCYAWAADVAEVEVDLDTYIPRVVRFYSAHDIGKALNPVLASGQIEGGSLQGLGWASMEEVRIKNGRYVNHRMTDCIIPTALDAPEMDIAIVEKPFKGGPHGAKGVGEIPMDLAAPAMVAAMDQATGQFIAEVPCTPEMLCALIHGQAGGAL